MMFLPCDIVIFNNSSVHVHEHSSVLFNLVLERCIRKIEINPEGNIYNRSCQYLAYPDNVAIMARTRQVLAAAYKELEREAQKAGSKINEEKTKYILMTRNNRGEKRRIRIGNHSFEEVQEFKYLGSTITENNETSEEIKPRIAAGNRSYYALKNIF